MYASARTAELHSDLSPTSTSPLGLSITLHSARVTLQKFEDPLEIVV